MKPSKIRILWMLMGACVLAVLCVLFIGNRTKSPTAAKPNGVAAPKGEKQNDIPLSYPDARFDRGELIAKVARGDKEAAYQLGTHYASLELPEAAYYWFCVADKLGSNNVDQSFLDYYEHTIIGAFDAGPFPKEPTK